jgi:hypothetical protein
MADITYHLGEQTTETESLKTFVRSLGIDLVGVANLGSLAGMPIGYRTWISRFSGKLLLCRRAGRSIA